MSRRRYRRRRRYYGRGSRFSPWIAASAPAVGYVAAKAAKMVAKKYLNPEYKQVETSNALAVDTTGFCHSLSSIAQGQDITDRIGRSIKAVSIQGILTGEMAAGTTDQCTIRFMLVRDNENHGTAATVTDVLGSAYDIRSLKERVTTSPKRFTILRDFFVNLSVTGDEIKTFKFYKKCNYHINYIGTAAATASNSTGTTYLIGLSDIAGGGNPPFARYTIRLLYLDN